MAQGFYEYPANYFGIGLRKVKRAQRYVKVTANLPLEEAASVSHSGPARPAPGADVRVDYMFRVGVRSDWLAPYL